MMAHTLLKMHEAVLLQAPCLDVTDEPSKCDFGLENCSLLKRDTFFRLKGAMTSAVRLPDVMGRTKSGSHIHRYGLSESAAYR